MSLAAAEIGTTNAAAPLAPASRPDADVLRFRPAAPVVRFERILRIQGYSDFARVRPAILAAAQAMALSAQALCRPGVAYRFLRVESLDEESVLVATGARLHSRAFRPRLSGCGEIVPFVLSCGDEIGARVIDLCDQGDLLEAVLLEAAGWLCIEDATNKFKEMLRQACFERGRRITSRMGPGYSYGKGDKQLDWPLENHAELFGLFGHAPLPATMMASCAMNPKLSRSGLYGIAPLHTSTIRAGRPG